MRDVRQRQTRKKRRTRGHVICDLSANYVELQALECGYSTERMYHDYGIDMNLYTYNKDGEIENGFVAMQLKATDNPDYTTDGRCICFPVKKSDLKHWLKEIYPVILVVYDAQIKRAYWVYIQNYFERMASFNLDEINKTISLKIETKNVVDKKAIKKYSYFRECVLAQSEGVVTHV